MIEGEKTMMSTKKTPTWAQAMVRNWRERAKIPGSISDDAIFTIVDAERLVGADHCEETESEIAYLRQELGLKEGE